MIARMRAACLSSLVGILALPPAMGGVVRLDEPVLPLPRAHGQDPGRASLGERLFHDPRLAADDGISCASCHPLRLGGTDRRPASVGIGGAEGTIKAPTVYNSRFNQVQFWDGRAESLEAQVAGPIHNPAEMGSSWPQVIAKLGADPDYPGRFDALYPDGITAANIQDAIATYERTLITPDSRFDRWLLGDDAALNEQELDGYRLFKSYGCVACHQGANLGGNMYQYMGAMGNYFADRGGEIRPSDLGRFNVTGDPRDRHLFKVPGLRLAAINPPYFHDGSTRDLEQAIRVMARYQLGREVPQRDLEAIAAFLRALVGNHPGLAR